MFKLDINTGELVAEWYTLPEQSFDEEEIAAQQMYNGASIYPQQAVIGDYFVFGL